MSRTTADARGAPEGSYEAVYGDVPAFGLAAGRSPRGTGHAPLKAAGRGRTRTGKSPPRRRDGLLPGGAVRAPGRRWPPGRAGAGRGV
ncbi:hypothetical protein AB0N19_39935, partial [Streptomyces sp. NPDC051132]